MHKLVSYFSRCPVSLVFISFICVMSHYCVPLIFSLGWIPRMQRAVFVSRLTLWCHFKWEINMGMSLHQNSCALHFLMMATVCWPTRAPLVKNCIHKSYFRGGRLRIFCGNPRFDTIQQGLCTQFFAWNWLIGYFVSLMEENRLQNYGELQSFAISVKNYTELPKT